MHCRLPRVEHLNKKVYLYKHECIGICQQPPRLPVLLNANQAWDAPWPEGRILPRPHGADPVLF